MPILPSRKHQNSTVRLHHHGISIPGFLLTPLNFQKPLLCMHFQAFCQGNAERLVHPFPSPISALSCPAHTFLLPLTLPLISCSFSRNFSCLSNEIKGHLRASLKEQRGEWDFSSLGRSQQSSGCTADAECPQIPNTCKHNREITNYLQFSLEKGIQRWIAHSAEVLPCLLFSSFTTKYIWVHFIMSCQRLFSLIICFISTARALLCYYSWYEYTIYSNHIPFLLQHATFHSFHIPLHNCKRISSKTPVCPPSPLLFRQCLSDQLIHSMFKVCINRKQVMHPRWCSR